LWGIDQHGASTILRTKLELVLKMLGEETSFLLDPRLHEELLGMEDQTTAANLRAKAILKALGADTGEDLTDLCNLFFEQKRSDEEEELEFAIEKSTSEAEKLTTLGLKIGIDDVVRLLTSYMQEKNSAANLETQRERLKRRNLDLKSSQDASKALNRQREFEFWEDMVDVVSPETDR
jgi:DNA-directed RNA polymerase beta subunit